MQLTFVTTMAMVMAWLGGYLVPVAYTATSLLAFASGDASTILDLAALAAIFGAFLAYNRMKTALVASESAAKSWHEEADAAAAKADRLVGELKLSEKERLEVVAKVTALEQRPDLSKLEAAVAGLAEAAAAQLGALTEATVRHEENAELRSERIVNAIKEGNGHG